MFDGFRSMHWEEEYIAHIKDVRIFPTGFGSIIADDGRDMTIYLDESYLMPALMGEVGELASIYAKAIRDDLGGYDDTQIEYIKKELGDILFMVAALADLYGMNLKSIAEQNVSKLLRRKARGTLSGSGDDR